MDFWKTSWLLNHREEQQDNMAKPTILYDDEYIHVINNETGDLELIEGPTRFVLVSSV